MQSLNFAFNDFFKTILYDRIGNQTDSRNIFIRFLAGGMAGMCATTILYPLEFCQTRIAVDIGTGEVRQ